MEELQQLQSARLKRLLTDQNIYQKDLAEMLGVSPTSVNHWVNGKVHMSDYNASLIHDAYPEYSVEYLRGYSEYPNETEAMRDRQKRHGERFFTELECIESLLKLGGVSVEYFSQASDDESEYTIIADGVPFTTDVRFNEFARLSRDGQSVVLTMAQWRAFRAEISQYMNLRIDSMFERGAW